MFSADFENTIAAVIQNYSGTLLASVSGGADSTALLAALAAIRNKGAAFDLHCIHIEHGIRPAAESSGDAEFVQSLCKKLDVPCTIVAIAPGKIAATAQKRGMGIEAAARQYRRRAWRREAARLKAEGQPVRVLTAHTADDMRETVLMRIIRGAGPAGLAAMPARRGRLWRPLLSLSRRDVLDYLSANNISWREDSTNADTQFLRNRIRHQLIPFLSEHFPQWREGLNSLAETQSLAAEFIREEAARRIEWGAGNGEWGVGKSLSVDAETFFAQPAIIREEALFQGIDRLLKAHHASRKIKSIKRANIRRFSEGAAAAVDLGFLDMRRKGANIVIAVKNSACEYGSFVVDCTLRQPPLP